MNQGLRMKNFLDRRNEMMEGQNVLAHDRFKRLLWLCFRSSENCESPFSQYIHIFCCIIISNTGFIFIKNNIQRPMKLVESKPAELPRQFLAERNVNLSIHSAPIKQTHLAYPHANEQIDRVVSSKSFPKTSMPMSFYSEDVCTSLLPKQ
jgi:hypothetical protein